MFLGVTAAAVVVFTLASQRKRSKSDQVDIKRTVVITGGAAGLGRATCEQLIKRGDIVVCIDVNADALRTLEAVAPAQLVILQADVADPEAVRLVAHTTAERLRSLGGTGKIDAIVNFAGLIRGGPMVEMDLADIKRTMDVNVLGTVNINQVFFPLLRRVGDDAAPKIINVASEISLCGMSAAMNGPYSMSKFAIEAYSTALRQELSLLNHPVSVIVLNPGAMQTPLVEDQMPGRRNAFFERHAETDTLWRSALLRGGRTAVDYMRRHASDPRLVAKLVEEVVHLHEAQRRYAVGVSSLMRLVGFLPQPLLDAGLRRAMKNDDEPMLCSKL